MKADDALLTVAREAEGHRAGNRRHYADLSEDIEALKCLRGLCCLMCVYGSVKYI